MLYAPVIFYWHNNQRVKGLLTMGFNIQTEGRRSRPTDPKIPAITSRIEAGAG